MWEVMGEIKKERLVVICFNEFVGFLSIALCEMALVGWMCFYDFSISIEGKRRLIITVKRSHEKIKTHIIRQRRATSTQVPFTD